MVKVPEKKKTVTFKISTELHRALRMHAARTDKTLEVVNTEALVAHLGAGK